MAPPAGNYETMIDALTMALWYACAGPLVFLPKKHEPAYYFPEGHMEHLQALIGSVPEQNLVSYDLSSKILCEVDNIVFMANPETDEVLTRIDLTPTTDVKTPTSLPEPKENDMFMSFSKTLTLSDTNSLGAFSVPRKHADNCLPALDMSKEKPSQDLVAFDLHNNEWRFKHSFRGKPKRHLLSNGWGVFVSSKGLKSGDIVIFLREENGALRVGIRRIKSQQFNIPEVLPPQGMHMGLLLTAAHSLKNKSSFSVFYRPRTMKPNFVVSVDKYLEAKNRKFDVGMRFTMGTEGEDGLVKRHSGTVVRVGANESRLWRNSEWKCLKVQWDEPWPSMPERVSPWEIEPLVAPPQSQPPAPLWNKRPRAHAPSASGGLRNFFAETPSDEPLFPPPAKTRSLGHGGINSLVGGLSGLSLWPNHGDDAAGPSQHSITKKNTGPSFRLFGCELDEGSLKNPEEEEMSE